MSINFRDLVRSGDIKWPVQKGFRLAAWNAAWEGCSQDEDGRSLFEAGLAFFDVLTEIRSELKSYYRRHVPKIADGELLRYYAALPNRDRFVVQRASQSQPTDKKNVFSQTASNNPLRNELTFSEVAEGSVDGMQKAVLACVQRLSEKRSFPSGSEPMELISFIKGEAYLSQLYGAYEAYWGGLVWGDYRFRWIDRSENIAEITQLLTSAEVAYEFSQIRRTRLSTNSLNEAIPIFHQFSDKYVILNGAGRQRKYRVDTIQRAADSLKIFNAIYHINVSKLSDFLPSTFLKKTYLAAGITVLEMLEVFRILVLLSITLMEKFPTNDEVREARDLLAFAPMLDLRKLSRAIAEATGLTHAKVQGAIEFMKYKEQDDDIWCQPIFEVDKDHIVPLVAALGTPNLLRVVEHWLIKLEVDLSEKGYLYEGNVLSELNHALADSDFATDYDEAKSKRVKLDNDDEEEIDLLTRIGSIVLVGEAKSIVSTDSPMSYYRARQILDTASKQAIRKAEFVKANIGEVFRRFGMKYEAGRDYRFVPVVINSNKMHVGFPVNGVPVCDEMVLSAYFRQAHFPLFSTVNSGRPRHLAWYELYDSPDTLEKNLEVYLNNLPQIDGRADSFELRSTYLPTVKDGSLKLIYRRAIPKDIVPSAHMKKDSPFPLRTVENIEEEIARAHVVI